MDERTLACVACGTVVPAKTTTCQECGYTVDRHDRWRFILGGLGTLFAVSVLFLPVGLPLLWRAHCHRCAVEGSVAGRRQASVRQDGTTAIRQHLGFAGE